MWLWVGRFACHVAGAIFLATLAELIGVRIGGLLSYAVLDGGLPLRMKLETSIGLADIAVLTTLYVLPFAIGYACALPVYRLVSALAWPRRAAWGPLGWGGLGLVAASWLCFAGAVLFDIGFETVSQVLIVLLIGPGFAVQVIAQRRAEERAETETWKRDRDAFA
jgi:hypothetical protein